jgi:cytochrome c2
MLSALRPVALVAVAAAVLAVVGCTSDNESAAIEGANPHRAGDVVDRYGCGSCHSIPGIDGADGTVGPSLADFGDRGVLAGKFSMTADNVVAWIMDPQAMDPGVAMPDMNVGEQDAKDIAAYLLDLHR